MTETTNEPVMSRNEYLKMRGWYESGMRYANIGLDLATILMPLFLIFGLIHSSELREKGALFVVTGALPAISIMSTMLSHQTSFWGCLESIKTLDRLYTTQVNEPEVPGRYEKATLWLNAISLACTLIGLVTFVALVVG